MAVHVEEHGAGWRPAEIVRSYTHPEPRMGERIVVRFTDERGGERDCFASSVRNAIPADVPISESLFG